jgi:hypothetical protein
VTRRIYPLALGAAVLSLAGLLWAAGPKPKAIPTPVYKVETTYSSAGDTLTEVRKVRPTNLPTTAKSWWITTVTPIIHVVVEGGELYVFPWQGGPSPNPGPEPKPDPKPDPQPIVKLFGIIIVEESKDRTPPQAAVQAAIHKACDAKKLQYARLDQNVVDETGKPPADMAAWLAKAKGKTLPYLLLVGENGQVAWEGSQPATEAAALELLKKYGGTL